MARTNWANVVLSRKSRAAMTGGLLVAFCFMLGGCSKWNFMDRSHLIADPRSGLVVPILSKIDPADEEQPEFITAEDVQPGDLIAYPSEYRIGKNDLVTVSVLDLMNTGVESVRSQRVSDTGTITLMLLAEPVKIAGMTESEVQRLIAQKYREANILPADAKVSVQVNEQRQKVFSMFGGVLRPGQYAIVDAEMRLLDALVVGGDLVNQQSAEFIYVIRRLSSERPADEGGKPQGPTQKGGSGPEDPLAPQGRGQGLGMPVFAGSGDPRRLWGGDMLQPELDEGGRYIIIDGKPRLVGATQPATADAAAQPDQPPLQVPPAQTRPTPQASGAAPTQPGQPAQPPGDPQHQFGAGLLPPDVRVIRVNYQALKRGDFKQNIVIRPSDTIVAPQTPLGVYYMGGQFARTGPYNLPADGITLKQATVAAGMLDPTGVPQRLFVIRRIGKDREVFVKLDLAQIFDGRQPDVFLKPNDTVLCGTDWAAYFLTVIRNGFRFGYGFGFSYDRNFADDEGDFLSL